MRLIDADAIPWTNLNDNNPNSKIKVLITFADKVNRMPTIEPEPKWIPCSERRTGMKPELIFVNEKDGTVTLSKEDLERIVDSAYKAGQADSSYITTTPWTNHPTWNDQTVPVMRKTDITCHEGNWAEGTQTKG